MPKVGEVYNVNFDGDIFKGVIYDKKGKTYYIFFDKDDSYITVREEDLKRGIKKRIYTINPELTTTMELLEYIGTLDIEDIKEKEPPVIPSSGGRRRSKRRSQRKTRKKKSKKRSSKRSSKRKH